MLPTGWLLYVPVIVFSFLWIMVCFGIGNMIFEITNKENK